MNLPAILRRGLLLLGFAAGVLRANEPESSPVAAAAGIYLPGDAIDLAKVLPEPPAPGSLAAQADLEAVRLAQAWRTPEQEAWAKFIEHDDAFKNAEVLGAWFTAENLPETARFIAAVTEDANLVSRGTKRLYQRARPPYVDPALRPCVSIPDSTSYPSGHAMRAWLWATVLGEIFPEQRAALEARAQRACWGRILGGVHFPSDVVGGRMLTEAIMKELRRSPAYRAGVEKCRAEVRARTLKKAA